MQLDTNSRSKSEHARTLQLQTFFRNNLDLDNNGLKKEIQTLMK